MHRFIDAPSGSEPLPTLYGDYIASKDVAAILPIDTRPGATFTLRLRDGGWRFRMTSESAVSIIVQPFSVVPFTLPFSAQFLQEGAGQITFVAGAGVTIRSPETLKTAKQYATVVLTMDDTDVWTLAGYLEASA